MACIPADDAFLIAAFPGVVQRQRERWVVTVLDAAVGEYSVTINTAQFPVDSLLADTVTTIRNALAFQLSAQSVAAISSIGVASIQIDEIKPGGLNLTVEGPAVDTIEATLVSGGDTNSAMRALWLAQALCSLPPCCVITCAADYTMMHAALAAHWIYTMGNIGGTGSGANDFDSMKLGPASLTRGKTAWSGNPADGDFSKTIPGQLYLFLRSKYVFPFTCV
jgi:hypothetical protein